MLSWVRAHTERLMAMDRARLVRRMRVFSLGAAWPLTPNTLHVGYGQAEHVAARARNMLSL